MTEIISVRFKESGKAYYFNPNGITIAAGECVVIDTTRGVEFGECVEGNHLIDERELVAPLRPVLRRATPEDYRTMEEKGEREKRAFDICLQKIAAHGLDMKLVEAEYSFDGSKLLFFFTSDGRVDFRELVRDLASVFHTRIELRQIGVRDEAKLLGGLGICGRPYCCHAFLPDFHPVSIKMAKTQGLSLNPTKISGACGRLMCCLQYEQDAYEDVLRRAPKLESLVETPDGVGTVNAVQLLREKVRVRLDDDPDEQRVYTNEQIRIIRNGKGKRPEGYELPEEHEHHAPQTRRLQPTAPQTEIAQTKPEPPKSEEKPAQEKKPALCERVRIRPTGAPKAETAPAPEPPVVQVRERSERRRVKEKKPAKAESVEPRQEAKTENKLENKPAKDKKPFKPRRPFGARKGASENAPQSEPAAPQTAEPQKSEGKARKHHPYRHRPRKKSNGAES